MVVAACIWWGGLWAAAGSGEHDGVVADWRFDHLGGLNAGGTTAFPFDVGGAPGEGTPLKDSSGRRHHAVSGPGLRVAAGPVPVLGGGVAVTTAVSGTLAMVRGEDDRDSGAGANFEYGAGAAVVPLFSPAGQSRTLEFAVDFGGYEGDQVLMAWGAGGAISGQASLRGSTIGGRPSLRVNVAGREAHFMTGAPRTSGWCHVAVVVDRQRGELRVFVDGMGLWTDEGGRALDLGGLELANLGTASMPVEIGSEGGQWRFRGQLARVVVSEGALRPDRFVLRGFGWQGLAFPGAEGAGKFARGGRGGDVYKVTNLNDSGPGSLRAGLASANGPRTIVFDVAGEIALASRLQIGSNVTIAGQTAPGDGVTIRNQMTQVRGDDVILRHLRFRLGEAGCPFDNPPDALWIFRSEDVMLDHLSTSWGIDEVLSVTRSHRITVQWSVISEGLYESCHDKGTRSYGSLINGGDITFHHNLFAHNFSRNPRPAGIDDRPTRLDFVNNLMYHPRSRYGYTGSNNPRLDMNYVGNIGISGPNTSTLNTTLFDAPDSTTTIHQTGNRVTLWYGAPPADWGSSMFDGSPQWSSSRIDLPLTSRHGPDGLRSLLRQRAGAHLARDAVDRRVIRSVDDLSGAHIDSPSEVGGYPVLHSLPPAPDSDGDGMPDWWEREMGLDPQNASDRNGHDIHPHYTNLEMWLDFLAQGGWVDENPRPALWTFGEGMAEGALPQGEKAVVNRHPGSSHGEISCYSAVSVINGALAFGGVAAAIGGGPALFLRDCRGGGRFDFGAVDSFTVEAVVRLATGGAGADGPLLAKGGRSLPEGWWLGVDNGRVVFRIADAMVASEVSTSEAIDDGWWHHVVAVRDAGSGTLRIYLNGNLAASANDLTNESLHSHHDFFLAGDAERADPPSGAVDFVRIVPEVLSPVQFAWAGIQFDVDGDGIPDDFEHATSGGLDDWGAEHLAGYVFGAGSPIAAVPAAHLEASEGSIRLSRPQRALPFWLEVGLEFSEDLENWAPVDADTTWQPGDNGLMLRTDEVTAVPGHDAIPARGFFRHVVHRIEVEMPQPGTQ